MHTYATYAYTISFKEVLHLIQNIVETYLLGFFFKLLNTQEGTFKYLQCLHVFCTFCQLK